MIVNVLAFGQIADITGEDSLNFSDVADTNTLMNLLGNKYSALRGMEYSIAVNKKIVRENTILQNEDTVALLPPFSGG